MTACIVGWSHLPFGKHEEETIETLIVKAAKEALSHAGIGAAEVDEIFLGHFNAGFSPQDFTAALVLQAEPSLRFKPAMRVENACATGSAAVHTAIRSSYQILDAQGRRVTENDLAVTEEHCQNRRRDYFIRYYLSVPDRIYPGKYTLQLTIVDTLSQKIGQSTVDFTVVEK